MCLIILLLIRDNCLLQDGGESGSGEEEDPNLKKRLDKTRNRASAYVKGGGLSRNSRNASKDVDRKFNLRAAAHCDQTSLFRKISLLD